jgi:hypothetical protein
MRLQHRISGPYASLVKKAKTIRDLVTYSLIADIPSALLVYTLFKDLIVSGKADNHEPHSILVFFATFLLFFLVLRSAGRDLVSQFVDPDTPIWGKRPKLKEEEFELLIERMERMTPAQARTASSLLEAIMKDKGDCHDEHTPSQ